MSGSKKIIILINENMSLISQHYYNALVLKEMWLYENDSHEESRQIRFSSYLALYKEFKTHLRSAFLEYLENSK